MVVYVINKHGKPLMPCKPSKARKLLKQKKAKVVRKEPFTIQLLYGSYGYKQEINLGVDCGSKTVGLSATTNQIELFSAELQLRNDIVDLLSTRKESRRTRRNRLRYRKARFDNRVGRKKKGWLAPSIENKINAHLNIIGKIHNILPITKIIVETASFDIYKLKNLNEKNKENKQARFRNIREYILFRDGHKCCVKGCKETILNVHHIESRKTGGNAPNNLITICKKHHKMFHEGKLKLNLQRGESFRDAIFMGVMRKTFYNRLKDLYPNVQETYGYVTKDTRITNGLPKEHRVDARCISGNPNAKPLKYWYFIKQVRKHNRKIHKSNILKGGKKKLNQSPYLVKGFRLFDKVEYEGKIGFIFGRRATGYFDIRTLDGTSIHKSAKHKQIKLLNIRKSLLIERRV